MSEKAVSTAEKEIKLQASNIDEEGNVLYLDEERLERKIVGFPRYKNKPNGLGIYNFLKQHVIYVSNKRWWVARKLYTFFVDKAKWFKEGGIKGKLYKKGIMIAPPMEKNTGTLVMPLNVDITDMSEKTVVPIDMLKESLKHVDYISGMDTCLCRESADCQDFPHDLGSLFLGEAAKTAVKHGLGHQITHEEACARIDKAAELGLIGQAVWIEVEQLLWGVRNDEMDRFLEVCFCCPCCCITMKLSRQLQDEDRIRFHPSGWTAVPDRTKCIGCGKCMNEANGCPLEAITMGEDGKLQINQEKCVGCGLCKTKCPVDAIKIKQTMPVREGGLREYFEKEFNLDLKIWKDENE
jgi:ferredoxin